MTPRTGHIGINVTDLERSRAFYADVFGLEVLGGSKESPQKFAFLGDESGLVLTLWEQAEGRFAPRTPGLHHLSFQAPSIDAVRELLGRLKARKVEIFHDGVVAHSEAADSGGVFFADPDGVRLEVFAPTGAKGSPAPSGEAPTCGFFA
jgi:catechol 2,3-dioxygenase-like lactoylglutathione lyase family enzyme